jgi:hypothetical protein
LVLLRRVSLSLLLVAWVAGAAHGKPVVTKLPERARVDWTRGVLIAGGLASADLHAPTPDVARVRSERQARGRARKALAERAGALPMAGGGTVAERVAGNDVARARLERAVERALDEDVDYASDGSVTVELALPIEAIRAAVNGPAAPAAAAAPATVIVRAGGELKQPEIGVKLRSGDDEYEGPVVYQRSVKAARADDRAGDVSGAPPLELTAKSFAGGELFVDGEGAEWMAAQPLVIVVIGK